MIVSAPGSSANLGPGFDALGVAVDLHFELAVGPDAPPAGAGALGDRPWLPCEPTHPAAAAHAEAGGWVGAPVEPRGLWWRSPIPPGRGLGFSGAARVAGAYAALAAAGPDRPHDDLRAGAHLVATALEHHPDNAAASAYGGFVAAAGERVARLAVPIDVELVVWWPSTSTSTDRSRATLPTTVPLADAAFNIGHAALVVGALVSGDLDLLADAVADRLHQEVRLAASPVSQRAIDAFRSAGAQVVWLSGSGPTVAALVAAGEGAALSARIEVEGRQAVCLGVDRRGVARVD